MKRLELEEINSKGKPLIIMTAVSICWSILFFNAYSATFLTLSAIVWLYYCITRATIRKLVISRSPDRERLFSGESLTVEYTIEGGSLVSLNCTIFPVIRAEREYLGSEESSVILSSDNNSVVETRLTFRKRGKKDISRVVLISRDPLRFFSHTATYSAVESVLVLPRVLNLDSFPLRLRELLPGKRSDFQLMEDPVDFKGIKEYEREPLNRIHWNASARLGKLMSKEFGYTAVSKTLLYLDLNLSKEIFARDVWEKIRIDYEEIAVQLALGLVRFSYETGGSIGLVVVGEKILRLSDSGRDWTDFAEALSESKGSDQGPQLPDVLEGDLERFDPSTTVVIVSLYLGEEILPHLLKARSHSSRVVVIIVPFNPREQWTKRTISYQMLPRTIEELRRRAALLEQEQIIVRVIGDNQSIQEVLIDLENR